MQKCKNNIGLIVIIAVASALISGALVFFGLQFNNSSNIHASVLDSKIDDAIERYVEKKQKEAEEEMMLAMQEEEKNSLVLAQNVAPVSGDDYVLGNKDAKVTLIEYSDFHCGYCRRFHPTAKELVDMYDGDVVNLVYRHYPLGYPQREALVHALSAECVGSVGGNDKFWAYVDGLMSNEINNEEGLIALAKDVGVNESAFLSCLSEDQFIDKIVAQRENGIASGVTGTPGIFVVNNETSDVVLIKGAQPYDVFKDVIDEML